MATQTITYSPTTESGQRGYEFKVPTGVTSITVDARGAAGATNGSIAAGKGGRVQTTLSVTPGDTLYFHVGVAGSGTSGGYVGGGNGPQGQGGGGATDIRTSGNAIADRLVVAGGGGGGGGLTGYTGGNGGGTTGGSAPSGGTGGTQSAGGTSGGALGAGGSASSSGCGGGGGYYGGGASTSNTYGGGGGSSFTHATLCSSTTHTQGYQSGNGSLVISYTVTTGTAPTKVLDPEIQDWNGTLTLRNQQWVGDDTISYAYQWENSDDSGASWNNCTGTGATSTTYTPNANDASKRIRLKVTATNSSGSGTAYSNSLLRTTFSYTGSSASTTVPTGVALAYITALGAKGGAGTSAGGSGGRVLARLTVTAGDTLNVRVGGQGTTSGGGGYNGGGSKSASSTGGGGGASDIRTSADALANRIIVAGGGGGGANLSGGAGGSGGGLTAGAGAGSGAGGAGSQSAGGSSGGALGTGGNATVSGGGSGGGGYYGGGGATSASGGGGGGSGYADATLAAEVKHTNGSNAGDGSIVITWSYPAGTNHAGIASMSPSTTFTGKAGALRGAILDDTGTVTFLAPAIGLVPLRASIASATVSVFPGGLLAGVAQDISATSTTAGKAVRQQPGKADIGAQASMVTVSWQPIPWGAAVTLTRGGSGQDSRKNPARIAPQSPETARIEPPKVTRDLLGR